jgi:hypothetical protein
MKAVPLKEQPDTSLVRCLPAEATHVKIHLPGPFPYRILAIILTGSRNDAAASRNCPVWTWNGSIDAPTLKPSILTRGTVGLSPQEVVCHTWISEGNAIFLGDSTHEFANQEVPLLEIEL